MISVVEKALDWVLVDEGSALAFATVNIIVYGLVT